MAWICFRRGDCTQFELACLAVKNENISSSKTPRYSEMVILNDFFLDQRDAVPLGRGSFVAWVTDSFMVTGSPQQHGLAPPRSPKARPTCRYSVDWPAKKDNSTAKQLLLQLLASASSPLPSSWVEYVFNVVYKERTQFA